MKDSRLNFLKPASPDELIGRQNELQKFRELLNSLARNEWESNMILIIGEAGSGKTSLLKAFINECQEHGFLIHELLIPLGPSSQNFLNELASAILAHAKAGKKTFFKRTRMEKVLPLLTPEEKTEKLVKAFVKKISRYQFPTSNKIIIAIDHLERFIINGYPIALQVLMRLARELHRKKLPIYFLCALEQDYYLDLKTEETNIHVKPSFVLQRFTWEEAEQFLLQRGPVQFRNELLRHQCIQVSDRTPFTLMFTIDLVYWAIQDLKKEKKLREMPSAQMILTHVNHILQKMDFETFIAKFLELSPMEHQFFTAILQSPKSIIKLEELASIHPQPLQYLKKLIDQGIVHIDKESQLIYLCSLALHRYYQLQSKSISKQAPSELDFLLRTLESDIRLGLRPNSMVLDRLSSISSLSNSMDELQSSQQKLEKTLILAKNVLEQALEKKFYHETYQLTSIVSRMLKVVGKNEEATTLLENVATKFTDDDQYHLAIKLLKKAINESMTLNDLTRAKQLSEKIYHLYLKLGREHLRRKPPLTQLARTYFYQGLIVIQQHGNDKAKEELMLKEIEKTYSKKNELDQRRMIFFKHLVLDEGEEKQADNRQEVSTDE